MIQRPRYKKWLDEFREKKLIKVLTGLRRSGKSTILDMYVESLKACGVAEDRIVYINFEMLEAEPLTDPLKLHKKILDSLVPGKMTYVFLDEVQHVTEYEKVMDSLYVRDGIDLYITGSTAMCRCGAGRALRARRGAAARIRELRAARTTVFYGQQRGGL